MFDPTKPDAILGMEAVDLALLPPAEDDRHEYKCSLTKDNDLADKTGKAASGFWNSGGGLFVVGLDGLGKPDGGIPLLVGRQPRRDWIDQQIARVDPRSRYFVQCIEDKGAGLNINAGSAVVLIGFGESDAGPHMAPDHRYYIRAGALTVPASQFIVDALYARRGLRRPLLRPRVRVRPDDALALQLGIVTLTEVPAISVSISLDPVPRFLKPSDDGKFILHVPVITPALPFFFDFDRRTLELRPPVVFKVALTYYDLANREYREVVEVDVDKQMPPSLGGGRLGMDLERAVEKMIPRFT